jgi:hypothetical protein
MQVRRRAPKGWGEALMQQKKAHPWARFFFFCKICYFNFQDSKICQKYIARYIHRDCTTEISGQKSRILVLYIVRNLFFSSSAQNRTSLLPKLPWYMDHVNLVPRNKIWNFSKLNSTIFKKKYRKKALVCSGAANLCPPVMCHVQSFVLLGTVAELEKTY